MKLLAALLLLSGCYLEHESDFGGRQNGLASPRESGAAGYTPAAEGLPPNPVRTPNGDPCEGGVVVAYHGCTRPGDAYWRKYCEGPYANCIAPGSPWSSTWGQR